jgi:hypothetical protein
LRAKLTASLLASTLLLQACATQPVGPTVEVLPGPRKSPPLFQQDVAACNQNAQAMTAGQADQANAAVLVGGVGGALVGGAVGYDNGHGYRGGPGGYHGHAFRPRTSMARHGGGYHGGGHNDTAKGAAIGALVGVLAGAAASAEAQSLIQWNYNGAYSYCMASRGNIVPQLAVYMDDDGYYD